MHFCIRVGISAQNRMIPSLALPQLMKKNWQRRRLRERENTRGVSLASNPRLRNQLKIKSGNNATIIVYALYKIMNYTLIPALISASSSEVIPVYLITVSSERLSAIILRTVFHFLPLFRLQTLPNIHTVFPQQSRPHDHVLPFQFRILQTKDYRL